MSSPLSINGQCGRREKNGCMCVYNMINRMKSHGDCLTIFVSIEDVFYIGQL